MGSPCHASEQCGKGKRSRSRECNCPEGSTGSCDEELIEQEECETDSSECDLPTPPNNPTEPCSADNPDCNDENKNDCNNDDDDKPDCPPKKQVDCDNECPDKPNCNEPEEPEVTTPAVIIIPGATTPCAGEPEPEPETEKPDCEKNPDCPPCQEPEPVVTTPCPTEEKPDLEPKSVTSAPAWSDDEDLSEGSGDNYNEPIYEEEPLLPEEEQPEPDCDEPECPECGNCDTDSSGDEPEEPEQPECIDDCPEPENKAECTPAPFVPEEPEVPEPAPEPVPEPEPECPS